MRQVPIALLDACVLVPMPLADTLLRLAEPPGLFEARWSDDILDEVTRVLERRFGKSPQKARYREVAMREFFPESLVRGHERMIPSMRNHPKDRHVLAAALVCSADYLVTFNLKDFRADPVFQYSTIIIDPSAFLERLWILDNLVVQERLAEQAAAIGVSVEFLLDKLANSVPEFANLVRAT